MISEFTTFIIHQGQTDKQVIKAPHNFVSARLLTFCQWALSDGSLPLPFIIHH